MRWPSVRPRSPRGGRGERAQLRARPANRMSRLAAAAVSLASVVLVAGCGGASNPPNAPASSTGSASVLPGGGGETTRSATKPATIKPVSTKPVSTKPATTSTSRGAAGKAREVEGTCPYVSNEQVALTEGNRVGRSTVVTTSPVGCRFYFAYGDAHMTARISVRTFATPTLAYNAMVRTGGVGAIGDPSIGSGAVLYQTSFYPPDGGRDWACTFAKGRRVVTVNTSQVSPSANARNLARVVEPKIH